MKAGLTAKLTLAYSGAIALVLTIVGVAFFISVGTFFEKGSRSLSMERAELIARFLGYAALLENEASLRARVESAQSFVDGVFRESPAGGAADADTLERIEHYLLNQRIGSGGYFYSLTKKGIVRFHPDEDIIGEDVSGEEFVREILKEDSGFVTYTWSRESDTGEHSKTAYAEWNENLGLYLVASDYSEGLFDRIPEKRLASILETVQVSEILAVTLWDETGSLLTASEGFREYKEFFGLPDGERDRQPPHIEEFDTRYLRIHYPLEEYGIEAVILYDRLRLIVFKRRLRLAVASLILVCVAAVFITSRIVAKAITSPLRRIIAFLSQGGLNGSDASVLEEGNSLNRILLLQYKLTYRLRREQRIREEAERSLMIAEAAFTNTNEGVCVTDGHGTILRVNPAFERITGYTSGEAVGKNPRILKSLRHSKEFYAGMWEQILEEGSWSGEIWNKAKDGTVYPELLTINRIEEDAGDENTYVAVFHDITEMRAIQDKIRHMANHDGLTGLPNRSYLDAILDNAIHRSARNDLRMALLFIDIDNFKDVNDSLGHSVGDLLLKGVADGISTLLRKDDVVARFGGDEFVVVLADVEEQDQVTAVAKKILSSVNSPFRAGEHVLHPSASIGIAFYPDSGSDAEALLRNADAAMYEAKKGDKNDYRFHDPVMNVKAHRRLAMQGRIQSALESGEMDCYFQPIYSLAESRIVGSEALVRWRKNGKTVPPDQFLPYIENTGTITKLDLWIAEEALSRIKASRVLPADFTVSVNAAPIDLMTPGFVDSVIDVVARTGAEASRMRIEITESAAVEEYKRVNKAIVALREAGIQIYIDDFGEGHSSIRYLREFGVNAVKLDRFYVMHLDESREAKSLVGGFIQLAHGIGLQAIIEGVEKESQLAFLEEAGADFIQGYLIGAPMPLRELEDTVAGETGRRGPTSDTEGGRRGSKPPGSRP